MVRKRTMVLLEVNDILETRKHSEQYISHLHSESLGRDPESFCIPDLEACIQRNELTIHHSMGHGVKVAAMNSLKSLDSRLTFNDQRKLPGRYISPFVGLLVDSERRECRDMQDRVYALYSMAPEKIQRLYPPDYDKHPGQVFHETVAYIFEYEYDGVDKLLRVYGFRDWETPSFLSPYPSWVPDFTAKNLQNGSLWMRSSLYNNIQIKELDRPRVLDDLQTLEYPALSLGNIQIILEFGNTLESVLAQIVSLIMNTKRHRSYVSKSESSSVMAKAGRIDCNGG